MLVVCVYMCVFIFLKSFVWFKGLKYMFIVSWYILKFGVVLFVSCVWFGFNVSVFCYCLVKCFRCIFL